MREYRTPGSARGPPGNRRSYLNGKMSEQHPSSSGPCWVAGIFRVCGYLAAVLAALLIYAAIFELRLFMYPDSGIILDVAFCLAALGCISYVLIARASLLSRREKWPAAIACLIIIVTFVVSPRLCPVRGRMWGEPGTGYLYYSGALGLGLAVVSLLREGGRLAYIAIGLSFFALLPGLSFLLRTFSH